MIYHTRCHRLQILFFHWGGRRAYSQSYNSDENGIEVFILPELDKIR